MLCLVTKIYVCMSSFLFHKSGWFSVSLLTSIIGARYALLEFRDLTSLLKGKSVHSFTCT